MAKENLEKIVENLSKLTVLELAELKTMLEEKWGVKAQAPVAQIAAVVGQGEAGKQEQEATEFNVTLEVGPADKKISIIKVVRSITGLGLKEAKEVVEKAPKLLKEHIPKAEAEEIKKKVEEAGGKVTLKGV